MTETASKELCAELYKLTGWADITHHGKYETKEGYWWHWNEMSSRHIVVHQSVAAQLEKDIRELNKS